MTEPKDITDFLRRAQPDDPKAASEILPLLYEQLRQVAEQRMQEERVGHTLQATALVHEAWLRLVGERELGWSNRAHFYVAAAEAMRRILIEHARKRGRIKRGGQVKRVPLSALDLAEDPDSDQILALDEAIQRLEEQDARAAKIVRLRFYAGLGVEETAHVMDLSKRTVMREWSFARAWLFRALDTEGEGTPSDE